MSARKHVLIVLCALSFASVVSAQPPEQLPAGHPPIDMQDNVPVGHPPIDMQEDVPAGHPPVDGQEVPAGHPHGDLEAALRPPNVARAAAGRDVPRGAIRVTVVDENDRPVGGSPVDIGVLVQGGDRQRKNGRTGANGVALFRDLRYGTSQAYRVNVPYRGAIYSSMPFQLPTDQGYDVRITRLPITNDDRFVFFRVFQTVVELHDERLHIMQQAQLTNAGRATFVFPTRGRRVALPPGALLFQAQPVMTDQHVEEAGGHAYTLRGSLPPGTVELAWGYELPIEDAEMRFRIDIPVHFFETRVILQAAHEMNMSVSRMPSPQRIEQEGQAYWVTGLQRGPTDPEVNRVSVSIWGIPRPGPLRWIAVAIAFLFLGSGVFLAIFRADMRGAAAQSRRRRRAALLAEAEELEKEHSAGEIGPEFRQKRRAQIVRELAAVLHEEEAAKTNVGRSALETPRH
jgi:hypothetical protein